MPENDKPKCPDCDVEIVLVEGKMPDKCAKCGFHLKGFGGFSRWFQVAARNFEKETADKKKKKTQEEGSDSPLAALGDL
jgi:ribosomal protein L37AE/L43A